MAKTIKFNLILDNQPVRSIEEIRENFSIEDLLKYFRSGLLHRWLTVRGYRDELAEVEKIKDTDDAGIIMQLVRIFQIETDEDRMKKGLEIFEFLKEDQKKLAEYKKLAMEEKVIIRGYFEGYEKLIQDIEALQAERNLPAIKAAVIKLEAEYLDLFRKDYYNLFMRLSVSAPMAIFVFLTRQAFRDYWLNEKFSTMLCDLVNDSATILGDNLKSFSGSTKGNWSKIEGKEKKVMIISVASGTNANVRSYGDENPTWDLEELAYRFEIFDGLEYQCNFEYAQSSVYNNPYGRLTKALAGAAVGSSDKSTDSNSDLRNYSTYMEVD